MKRVIGFGLFWLAAGMIIDMILSSLFIQVLLVVLCILIGYQLFCCK